MKWSFALLSAPILCGAAFVVAYVLIVSLTIPQLPVWAQPGVSMWLMDIPQDSEYGIDEGDGSSPSTPGAVGWEDYTGPEGEVHGLPLVGPVSHWGVLSDLPILGCLFHDPAYGTHTGVDFPVDIGTPVHATLGGKVIWAGENGAWGNLVVIQNGDYQVWLAHLDMLFVSEGEIVGWGEVVGLSGNTGNSTGAHVHYGIKYRTEAGSLVWLDPQGFFSADEVIRTSCGE